MQEKLGSALLKKTELKKVEMNTQAVIRKNLSKQLKARRKSGTQLTKLQVSVLNKSIKMTVKELNQAAE